MLTIEETGAIMLTKEGFCKRTGMKTWNWIFNEIGENPRFWMYLYHDTENPDRYYYDNDIDCIREFKHMDKYKETWMRVFKYTKEKDEKHGEWSLWNTWHVW